MATIYDFRNPPNVEQDIDVRFLAAFAHNPKCAGNSIKNILKPYQIPKQIAGLQSFLHVHTDLGTLRSILVQPFTIFSCIRNPWEREVSGYEYLRKMYKELKNDEPNASILFANDVSFEEYITVKYNTYKTKNMYSHCMPCFGYKNYECMSLWLPQKYFAFTEGSPTEGECDWVFRLETLERDLNQFLERYDIEPLPILHDNKTHPRNYMDYYNDKTKDYVYKMEKELIEVYKYEF